MPSMETEGVRKKYRLRILFYSDGKGDYFPLLLSCLNFLYAYLSPNSGTMQMNTKGSSPALDI